MTELENPVTTLLRLMSTRIRVIRDDSSIASILYTPEHYDREFMKTYDAVITLSVDTEEVKKLNLSGTLRQRIVILKCLANTVDRTTQIDPARAMRDKVVAAILACIQENRTLPYQTIYNFYALGYMSTTHKAYDAADTTELAPSSASWSEISVANYQKLWSSDDVRHSKSTSALNKYALMLFRFKVGKNTASTTSIELEAREECLKQLVLAFEGYGTAPTGNGVTFKIWDHVTSTWTNVQIGTGSGDETLTITLTTNLTNYVDASGYLYIMARTTNQSDGATPAVLYCDFVQCALQVTGLTFCDVASFREADEITVKPYIWKTEFRFRGYMFETISGVF